MATQMPRNTDCLYRLAITVVLTSTCNGQEVPTTNTIPRALLRNRAGKLVCKTYFF